MPRQAISASVSFDPKMFELMESRRKQLLMDRSEYIRRLILNDMAKSGGLVVLSLSEETAGRIASSRVGRTKSDEPQAYPGERKPRSKTIM